MYNQYLIYLAKTVGKKKKKENHNLSFFMLKGRIH